MLSSLTHEKESIIPSTLIQDLRNGNVLAWVGAGLSIGMGYPSWETLICKIAENIDNTLWGNSELQEWSKKNANSAPEWVAEVLSQTHYKGYTDALMHEFERDIKSNSYIHAFLSLLPFKGYITTNYDSLIENNLEKFISYKPNIYTPKNAPSLLSKDENRKFIYKVHGSISSDLEYVILTETDYYSLMKDKIYSRILSSLFSKYTLVGFGYSLRDRDFRSVLNERYELFGNNCPPFYMFTSSKDTCQEEIDCYRNRFNVHIVSISPEYGFQELSSTIFSMYCLCHRIDSTNNSKDILELLDARLNGESLLMKIANNPILLRSNQFLSGIKDPLEMDEIVSILSDNCIDITSAHVELLCKWVDNKRLICAEPDEKDADRFGLAKILKKNIDVIPIDNNPKFLSSYYKKIIDKYYKTLSELLIHQESFEVLITNKNELKRISEYYKQQGLWKEWLYIASVVQNFCNSNLKIDILQSIAWVYFWTRDYNSLKDLLNKYPQIDKSCGVNNYSSKLAYMNPSKLNAQAKKLKRKYTTNKGDYFDISLLGRVYARLSIIYQDKRDTYLSEAEFFIKEALERASKMNDMIEIAVQNWYLALILIDKGEVEKAKIYLAEAKRLDENIMERKPGIAWLKVAEYRLALATNQQNANSKRRIAYQAMNKLGMKDIDEYLDKEYFF